MQPNHNHCFDDVTDIFICYFSLKQFKLNDYDYSCKKKMKKSKKKTKTCSSFRFRVLLFQSNLFKFSFVFVFEKNKIKKRKGKGSSYSSSRFFVCCWNNDKNVYLIERVYFDLRDLYLINIYLINIKRKREINFKFVWTTWEINSLILII